jgi:zinc and cadmium transporter
VAGLVPERWLTRAREPLVGFAAGVLLATTFLDILPEALGELSTPVVLALVLASMTVMLVLEWTIGHRGQLGDSARTRGLATILLGADAFHNAADGAAIAAAFVASTRLGVITAAAVIIHEVPEEVADYVLLRRAGMPRLRALVAMAGVQLTAAIGAIATLIGAAAWRPVSAVALAVAGGTFLHIAEVDLIPTVLERGSTRRRRAEVLLALLAGLAVVVAESAL